MRITRRDFLRWGGALAGTLSAPGPAFGKGGRLRVPVLLYHDISDDFRDDYTVSPARFAAQMEWLYGNGYRAVPLRELARLPGNAKAVVITFDDGYASFLEYAWPLFREYGFHSTINVIGSSVGSYLDVGGNRPMLSWDEYRYLLRTGAVDLGCHTYGLHAYTHRGVIGVPGKRLEEDLEKFRELLRRETGGSTEILAWPYGLYEAKHVEIARRAGFRYLLTSGEGDFTGPGDLSAIPRKNVNDGYDIHSFKAGVES
ncbi:MAG: polysaccharide deacetylase family protein [Thermodesulfobacteriota bacterium]